MRGMRVIRQNFCVNIQQYVKTQKNFSGDTKRKGEALLKRLIAVAVLVVLSAVTAFGAVQDSSGSSNIETVSAETLLKAYMSNPYKARKTYQGKTLEVRGKINEMQTLYGKPAVSFMYTERGNLSEAWCYISTNDPLLVDLERGKNATIRGYVSEADTSSNFPEYVGYVLTDCKIISAN